MDEATGDRDGQPIAGTLNKLHKDKKGNQQYIHVRIVVPDAIRRADVNRTAKQQQEGRGVDEQCRRSPALDHRVGTKICVSPHCYAHPFRVAQELGGGQRVEALIDTFSMIKLGIRHAGRLASAFHSASVIFRRLGRRLTRSAHF